MPESDGSAKSWWTTMPGLLTGLAAVITAGGGLIAALVQGGFIGSRAASSTTQATTSPAQPAGPATGGATGGATQVSQAPTKPPSMPADAANTATVLTPPVTAGADPTPTAASLQQVRVTTAKGKVVTLLPSFEIAGDTLPLSDGQEVRFDRLDRIEIGQPWDGRLKLVMSDGKTLDSSAVNLPANGISDLGSYTAMLSDLKRIEFVRKGKP